jgi:hypothetical protein
VVSVAFGMFAVFLVMWECGVWYVCVCVCVPVVYVKGAIIRPHMHPHGALRRGRTNKPFGNGYRRSNFRTDVQYRDGGRAETQEQLYARVGARDPRVVRTYTKRFPPLPACVC